MQNIQNIIPLPCKCGSEKICIEFDFDTDICFVQCDKCAHKGSEKESIREAQLAWNEEMEK